MWSNFINNRIKAVKEPVKLKNSKLNLNIRNFLANINHKNLPKREDVLLFEVLIPSYNQAEFLETAINSVMNLLPITVINDASDFENTKLIEKLYLKYKFNLITNQLNKNQGGSINKAVLESNSNAFMILNADDALLPYTIEVVTNIFEKNNTVRLIGGSSIPFHNSLTTRLNQLLPTSLDYEPKTTIINPDITLQYKELNDLNMTMSSSAFLKSAWKAVGGYFEYEKRVCSYDDRDFQYRVATLFDVALVDEPLAWYRLGSSMNRSCE